MRIPCHRRSLRARSGRVVLAVAAVAVFAPMAGASPLPPSLAPSPPTAAPPRTRTPAPSGASAPLTATAPLPSEAPLPLPAGFRWREDPRLEALFREAGLEGTFVLHDGPRRQLVGCNRSRALTRFSPASTFKIANSLIGLSVGAVASVDTVLPYRSDAAPFSPAWEKDMGLREAILVSNVPIYQELARRIGLERMREAVNRLDYGNRRIGSRVDTFWLRGPLAISAVEQTRFLERLALGQLPFPAEAQRAVRQITLEERGPGWELHAKTGWQNGPGPGVGWWVGWVRRGGRVHPFALNLAIRERADGDQRQRIGRAALVVLAILPPPAGSAAPPSAVPGSATRHESPAEPSPLGGPRP